MGEGRGNYETDLEDILFQLWHSQTHMNILLFLTQLDIQHGYQHTGMYQSRLNLMLGCLEMFMHEKINKWNGGGEGECYETDLEDILL